MWFKETRALIGRGLNCIFPHSTSAPFPSNYDTAKHIFKIIFRKQPLFLQAKETGKVQLKIFHGYWSHQKLSSYQFVKFNLLRAYLHGTTLSHATSLRQAYDTNCFV